MGILNAQAFLTLSAGASGSPVWLDEQQILYAFGNGVIAQHIEKGTQVGQNTHVRNTQIK
jgi:hypothetical protein